MALVTLVFGTLCFAVAPTTWFWDKPMWLPADYSEHGHEIDKLYYFILALTGVVFLATEFILFYFMWKYDANTNKEPVVYSHGSHSLEIVWTIIPAATLLFIAIVQFNSWAESKMQNPMYGADGLAGPNPETNIDDDMLPTVEVTGRQWEWRIRYPGADGRLGTPDDIFDVNELHVPANQDVVVSLKSSDVLHSFFIPNLRVKQDAVPGMKIPVWFKVLREDPNVPLDFEIVCAEHCGARHYAMKGRVIVHSAEEYQSFLRRKFQEQSATVDPQAAAAAGSAE
jgi:cytochrome c oxidase subunit 2